MEDVTVHRLLTAVAETPAPPTRVDIARAAHTGRRTRRVRRIAASSSAAAVVAAIAVTAVVVAGGARPAPPPAATPVPSSSSAAPEALAAPTAFDPLGRYASFVDPLGTAVEVDLNTLADLTATWYSYDAPAVGCSCIGVAFVSAGHGIDAASVGQWQAVELSAMPAGEPADPVDGHQAQWVAVAGGLTGLRWEYAPDTWAEVALGGIVADPRALARQVASSMALDRTDRVRLPVDLAAVPAPFTQTGIFQRKWLAPKADAGIPAGYAATLLGFRLPDQTDYVADHHRPLEIGLTTGNDESLANPNPSYYATAVDGYPAHVDQDGQSLAVFANPIGVTVQTFTDEAAAALPDGLAGLFTGLDVRLDPATWY